MIEGSTDTAMPKAYRGDARRRTDGTWEIKLVARGEFRDAIDTLAGSTKHPAVVSMVGGDIVVTMSGVEVGKVHPNVARYLAPALASGPRECQGRIVSRSVRQDYSVPVPSIIVPGEWMGGT